jgi:uncharacterized protein (DUF2235 family)
VYSRPDSPTTVDDILIVTAFLFANNALRWIRRFRNIDKETMDVRAELQSRAQVTSARRLVMNVDARVFVSPQCQDGEEADSSMSVDGANSQSIDQAS